MPQACSHAVPAASLMRNTGFDEKSYRRCRIKNSGRYLRGIHIFPDGAAGFAKAVEIWEQLTYNNHIFCNIPPTVRPVTFWHFLRITHDPTDGTTEEINQELRQNVALL